MKTERLIVWGVSLLFVVCLAEAVGQDASNTLQRGPEGTSAPAPLDTGVVRETGYLGMTVDLLAPDGKSVYVVSVTEGGPSATAGIKANDVIMEINGKLIGGLDDVDRIVRQPAGTTLEFKVRRAGVPQRFAVTLATRPAETPQPEPAVPGEVTYDELPPPPPAAAERAEPPLRPVPRTDGGPSIVEGSRPNLGISVTDISDLTKRRFGVVVDTGAVISRIEEGTPAARAGLPLGGVIVSINGKRIGNANDIVALIQAFRPGDEIEVTYFDGDRAGRKRIRLGRSAAAVVPTPRSAADDATAAAPADPPLQLGRRRSGRPLLDVLERTLDAVLPPATESRTPGAVAPPTLPTPDA